MKRTIRYDVESLKKFLPGLEAYNPGALTLVFETVKTRFMMMLAKPELIDQCHVSEVDLCSEGISGSYYGVVVDGRQVQIQFRAIDLDVRGYNGSWFLTNCVTFTGNETAVLSLSQLFTGLLARLSQKEIMHDVSNLLSKNQHHFVLIDHRRPFYQSVL